MAADRRRRNARERLEERARRVTVQISQVAAVVLSQLRYPVAKWQILAYDSFNAIRVALLRSRSTRP